MTPPSQPNFSNPDALSALQTVLDLTVDCLERLELKLGEKKNCLIANDVDRLQELDREILALHRESRRLERERQFCCEGLGIDAKESLRELAGRLSNPQQSLAILTTRSRLNGVLTRIGLLNQDVESLLALSMQWINATVSLLLSSAEPEGAAYTAQGRRPGGRAATEDSDIGSSATSLDAPTGVPRRSTVERQA
jgi:hypothetical protein